MYKTTDKIVMKSDRNPYIFPAKPDFGFSSTSHMYAL